MIFMYLTLPPHCCLLVTFGLDITLFELQLTQLTSFSEQVKLGGQKLSPDVADVSSFSMHLSKRRQLFGG